MEEHIWHKHKWPEGVPWDVEVPEVPLFHLLEDTARQYGELTYTIFQDSPRTFRQVNEMANQVANFLASKGIGKGDRVAMFLPNLPHYPILFFGILKSGATCVTCNPMYTAGELNFQLKDSGARAVFVMDHPQFYATACKAVEGSEVELTVYCNVKPFLPTLKGVLGGLLGKIPKADRHERGHISLEQALFGQPRTAPQVSIDPKEDLALILYTGGTTGVPKGACLTHYNFMANVVALEEWMRVEPAPGQKPQKLEKGGKHCFMGVLPWYHSYGLTLTMLSAVKLAARLICVPDPRAGNPPFTELLRLIEHHKATLLHAVPTLYSVLVNHPLVQKFDLRSIVACASGAAPLPVELAKRFEEKTGAVIFEGYGLSETSPVTHVNPTKREDRKFGSIGLPIPGTDMKILDVETGTRELPLGEDGEIAVSGPQVMKGYWNRPEENELVFRTIEGKRFFLTGDIGHMDEEGFTVITDRKKDMIDVGGLKAYPREIEEVLYGHPKVANAAVVGVPDEKSGQAVKAFIQLKPGQSATAEEIIEFCRDKMAGYKRPKYVEFRESLPMTTVGKILRRQLRDEEWSKLKMA
ncbi:MAG: long-chain-fatty-acid--CoA ligase [Thermodesulfobacteriota bacterium]